MKDRLQSIDMLRGLVMVLMALDHIRDFFHYDAFYYDPLDLTQTSPVLFFTRFITHFCAPVFVFLAGTSAFFVGKKKDKKTLSLWLLKRGFWLVLLELTLIKFAWTFNPDYSYFELSVLWALGIGMIFLAGIIYLPKTIAIAFSALFIAGHNLFDGFVTNGTNFLSVLWRVFHVEGIVQIPFAKMYIAYPVLPWIALMSLGYFFGELYKTDFNPDRRRRILLFSGGSLLIIFLALRSFNLYGDVQTWAVQPDLIFTILSFINLTKYPPSLLYLLITIGPALIFLALTEKTQNSFAKKLVIVGRVPMFFYIIHLYAIHILALIAAVFTGFSFQDMIIHTWITEQPELKGYGFSLGVIYLIWICFIVALYPLFSRYNDYKTNNRQKWWLSYL